MSDYDTAADEPVPTLQLVGAFLGGAVIMAALIFHGVKRYFWIDE